MGKSLIKSLLLSTALMSGAYTDTEEFGFVGVSLNYQQIDLGIWEQNYTTLGIRVGQQNLNWRTTFGFEYATDFSTLFIEADYIFLDEMFGTSKLRPYFGLNLNYIDCNNFYDYSKDITIDEDGYSIGGNFGFIIYAGDRVDVDIGYHYNVVQGMASVDVLQGVTFSIHYFY